jgi:hypothetical protein
MSSRTLIVDVDCVISCEVADFDSSGLVSSKHTATHRIVSARERSRMGQKFEVLAMNTSSILVVEDYVDLREGLTEILDEMLARFDPSAAGARLARVNGTT